jgi:hypothetical protein
MRSISERYVRAVLFNPMVHSLRALHVGHQSSQCDMKADSQIRLGSMAQTVWC